MNRLPSRLFTWNAKSHFLWKLHTHTHKEIKMSAAVVVSALRVICNTVIRICSYICFWKATKILCILFRRMVQKGTMFRYRVCNNCCIKWMDVWSWNKHYRMCFKHNKIFSVFPNVKTFQTLSCNFWKQKGTCRLWHASGALINFFSVLVNPLYTE